MSWIPATPLFVASIVLIAGPNFAAQGDDPDWPCIQRKVPELSLGQIWNGGELPQTVTGWEKDERVSALVEEVAARRVSLPDAQQKIRDFSAALPDDRRQLQMTMIMQGLFDHMNVERSHVIDGIARYAHRQRNMASALRQEASAVDLLRARPDADQSEIARRSDRLTFQTRVFQERVQSLTFVCEVPTLIEQRLYALAKTISDLLAAK